MFLCYGQEEFFDCRDDMAFDVPLTFSDMLEQRHRRQNRNEQRESQLEALDKLYNRESFTTKLVHIASEQLIGVKDLDFGG